MELEQTLRAGGVWIQEVEGMLTEEGTVSVQDLALTSQSAKDVLGDSPVLLAGWQQVAGGRRSSVGVARATFAVERQLRAAAAALPLQQLQRRGQGARAQGRPRPKPVEDTNSADLRQRSAVAHVWVPCVCARVAVLYVCI